MLLAKVFTVQSLKLSYYTYLKATLVENVSNKSCYKFLPVRHLNLGSTSDTHEPKLNSSDNLIQ